MVSNRFMFLKPQIDVNIVLRFRCFILIRHDVYVYVTDSRNVNSMNPEMEQDQEKLLKQS